jgi:hypothetical protein
MSADFLKTPLWLRTLGAADGDWAEQRDTLRSAYLQFRERVKPLANEIAQSMPMFTDHSIDHVDSLWDIASLLLPPDFPLNPAEAFVLGGSFLMHDLGMGLAAYPDGLKTLEHDPMYNTLMASAEARAATGSRNPLDETSIKNEVVSQLLRLRHAGRAEHLMTQRFLLSDQSEDYLLSDGELRLTFGPLIGKIAHSHWFDTDELPRHFDQVKGSHPKHDPEWSVDPLKIACILRLSDAAHIDSRRAPSYLHALRRPDGVSHNHWYFQERLMRPLVEGDRLTYTSTQEFLPNEAPSWWLAYDTLKMIDSELRRVDSLCVDYRRPRFVVNAVSGADSPARLAKFITVADWQPVDATIRVSEVESLVSSLGGKELYGNHPWVAVRELIANGADATRARVLQYGGSAQDVIVRLSQEGDEYWLTVRDHGIGMSPDGMVRGLTDFGHSEWLSANHLSKFPSLTAKGYRPTGRFGIGFFSVFMIADYVEVKSLEYLAASESTAALVFSDGVRGRPIVTNVPLDERLVSGGTEVRLRLRLDPLSEKGLFGTTAMVISRSAMLERHLAGACALVDVDLSFQGIDDDRPRRIVTANEWKSLPPRELFRKIYSEELESPWNAPMYSAYENVFAENAQDVLDDEGEIVGRAILAAGLESMVLTDVWWWPAPRAKVFVGGLEADSIWSVLGVFTGEPLKADRQSAFPVASAGSLKTWAESQTKLLDRGKYATVVTRYHAAELARSVGASIPSLPCGYTRDGGITPAELDAWVRRLDSVVIVPDFELHVFHRDDSSIMFIDRTRGRQLRLPKNAFVADIFSRWFFPDEVMKRPTDERFAPSDPVDASVWDPRSWWHRNGSMGSMSILLESVSRAWKADPADLVDNFALLDMTRRGDDRLPVKTMDGDETVLIAGYRLVRP